MFSPLFRASRGYSLFVTIYGFAIVFLKCWLYVSLLSSVMPRYFIVSVGCMLCPLMRMFCTILLLVNFFVNSAFSVFSGFSCIFHLSKYFVSKSVCICNCLFAAMA